MRLPFAGTRWRSTIGGSDGAHELPHALRELEVFAVIHRHVDDAGHGGDERGLERRDQLARAFDAQAPAAERLREPDEVRVAERDAGLAPVPGELFPPDDAVGVVT